MELKHLLYEIQLRIESGEFERGRPLPSVSELQKELNASEDEVRRAISELIHEGVLERVRPEPPDQVTVPTYDLWGTLTGIHSITREARKRGVGPGVEILSFETVPVWPAVAERLELGIDEEVVIMERLRTADGEPVAIEGSYFPAKYMSGVTKEMFEGKGKGQSSFEVMQKKFGLKPARAVDELTAIALEKREAELLGMEPGTPILLRFRTTYSDNGVPIKCSRAVWKFKAGYQMDL
ncbi:MAG: GntR family transcriptional regulator [Chloroflexota bacterium]